MTTGNQHSSRKATLLVLLHVAREALRAGHWQSARSCLFVYRMAYNAAPASTRRRWRAGQ